MNILILGGNRFMGVALVEQLLLDTSFNITVFNRKGTGPEGVTIIKGDRNNSDDLNKIDFKSYDYIVDMCLFKPEQFELFKPFLESCNPKKYIFISSAAVGIKAFGDYATEKEEVENLIKSTNIKYEIIRPVYVVGENSHRPRLGYYINQIQTTSPISVSGEGTEPINLVHVSDVVNIIIDNLFSSPKFSTVIVSNGQSLTQIEIINRIKAFLGSNKDSIELNKDDAPFLNEKFTFKQTNSNMLDLENMLSKYIEWFEINKQEKYGY